MNPYCPYQYNRQVAYNFLPPEAAAIIKGGPLAPQITGVVTFKNYPGGTEVCVDVCGLPPYQPAKEDKLPIGPFGFHIHEKGNCEIGDPNDPFKSAGGHWNPTNQPHGNHYIRVSDVTNFYLIY